VMPACCWTDHSPGWRRPSSNENDRRSRRADKCAAGPFQDRVWSTGLP
jgi:hypothetical protein